MQRDRVLKIATMGNVDSGKSTLAGLLLHHWRITNIHETVPYKIVDSLQFERDNHCTWNIGHGYGAAGEFRFHILDDPGHLNRFDITLGGLMAADLVLYTIDPEKFDRDLFDFHIFSLRWLGKTNILFILNLRETTYESKEKQKVRDALAFHRIQANTFFEFDVLKTFLEAHSVRDNFVEAVIDKAAKGGQAVEAETGLSYPSALFWNTSFADVHLLDDQYPTGRRLHFNDASLLLDDLLIEVKGFLKVYKIRNVAFAEQNWRGFGLFVQTKSSEPIGLMKFCEPTLK